MCEGWVREVHGVADFQRYRPGIHSQGEGISHYIFPRWLRTGIEPGPPE